MSDKSIISIANEHEMAGFIKANGTGCRYVSMTSKTPVVKIRAGNPWHKVSKGKVVGTCRLFKLSKKIGLINANYVTSVETRIAEKLGVPASAVEYTPGEVYYEHLLTSDGKPLPLVQHKDETKRTGLQLQYFPQKSTNCYVTDTGEIVPDDVVKPWLHAESERSEYKPAVMGIYLRNILELKASGLIVQTEDFDAAKAQMEQAETLSSPKA